MCVSTFTSTQVDAGWEEYYDYIFPEDEAAQPNLKLLAMAKQWKIKQDKPEEEEEQDTSSDEAASDVEQDTDANGHQEETHEEPSTT